MTYTGASVLAGPGASTGAQVQAWLEFGAAGGAAYVELPEVPIEAGTGDVIVAFGHLWNINWDMLAALIAHESAFLQSKICRDKNNPGGYGAENDDPYNKATTFATLADGIRAVAAHLASYVHGAGAWNTYSPRYSILVAKGYVGAVRVLTDLNGKWAWPGRTYGQSLARMANDLLAHLIPGPTMKAQIPGFLWYPADATHFEKGRTGKIRGGAQHYTKGTNSLPWLTGTSKPPVSATFLVKKNATMENRGWQLVRIEDTAWTTAYANPYTVSVEYEHTGNGAIPDGDYAVLIQTWKDIREYVEKQKLGALDQIAGHKVWVQNPTLVCPDGIDIERIVRGVYNAAPVIPTPTPSKPNITTVPDPWKSPHGNYWVPEVFVNEINLHDWMTVGYALSGAFEEEGLIVQYFERARLELQPNGKVTRGLVGLELLDRKHPGIR